MKTKRVLDSGRLNHGELEDELHVEQIGRYYNFSVWLRDHLIVTSLIVFICAVSPRVYLTWLADPSNLLFRDSSSYLAPASSLLESGAFLNEEGKPAVTRTPGYPVFLALLMSVFGSDLGAIALAQSILNSLSVLILYWLARGILPPIMAFIGGLLAAFSPWSIAHAGFFLTEGLYLLILALIFFAIYLIENAMKRSIVLLGGAFVGLLTSAAVLVRPNWPLVLLVALTLFLRYGPSRKGVWAVLAVMVFCAVTPLYFWKVRNINEAQFHGLSNIASKTAWRYLAARVQAQVEGLDRTTVRHRVRLDDRSWDLSIQEADNERWRRTADVFREHPFLTVYCYALNVGEHILDPSTYILKPAGLNFSGDSLALKLWWGVLLIFSILGWLCKSDDKVDYGKIDYGWLLPLLGVCLLLTLSTGISFNGGARLRNSLELIVPLLAAVGLVRFTRSLQQFPEIVPKNSSIQMPFKERPVLAVIIPVYNKVDTVERLIRRLLSSPINLELRLYVVDDASKDGSDEILVDLAAKDPRITVLFHTVNQGKGMAIRTAINAAEGDFAVIQDVDFECNPEEYDRILAPLVNGDADAVFGSRYLRRDKRTVFSFWHSLGNWFLTILFNIGHDIHLTDIETCYQPMSLKLLKNLRLTTDRFGIEYELAARLVAVGARIIEVPISYKARNYQQDGKIRWKDGFQAFCLMLKFRYVDKIPCTDVGMVRHLAMAAVPCYQQALANDIKPFLGARVLEVGAGIGNLARNLTDTKALFLSESIPEYYRQLSFTMQNFNNVTVSTNDLFAIANKEWAKRLRLDTVVCVNQLEYLDDDRSGLSHLAEVVEEGGRLILCVPCHDFLYGRLDMALGMRRRYDFKGITDLIDNVGLQVEHTQWRGKILMLGWFIQGKLLHSQFFSSKPLALLNIFSPILKVLDQWLPLKGLSLLVVARKPSR